MQEFLVKIEIDTTGIEASTLDILRAKESERAAELATQGHLTALWRVQDRYANFGIWRAANTHEVNKLVDSLPLRPYMTVDVEALVEHPNAPQKTKKRSFAFALPELKQLELKTRSTEGLTKTVPRPNGQTPAKHRLTPFPRLTLQGRGTRENVEHTSAGQAMIEVDVLKLVQQVEEPARAELLLQTISEIAQMEYERNGGMREILFDMHRNSTDNHNSPYPPKSLVVTNSGAYGLRYFAHSPNMADITIDVGAIVNEPRVQQLVEGDSGIQIRPVVALTLSTPLSIPFEIVGTFLSRIRDQVQEHISKGKK